MSKPVVAVVVCTLLALVAAATWVPVVPYQSTSPDLAHPELKHMVYGHVGGSEFDWIWSPRDRGPSPTDWQGTPMRYYAALHWPILLLEHTVILLLGGGLLTFVVRRERRRKAAA